MSDKDNSSEKEDSGQDVSAEEVRERLEEKMSKIRQENALIFDRNTHIPLYLRFHEGTVSFDQIQKEVKSIKEYAGRIGEIIAGGKTIGQARVIKAKDKIRIKIKNLPKKPRADDLYKCKVKIRCEFGTARLNMNTFTSLTHGSIIPLNKLFGEPVDVIISDRTAKGELVIINKDNYGVRLTELAGDRDDPGVIESNEEPEIICTILLGETEMTAREARELGEGSIITLDNTLSGFFSLLANGSPAFKADYKAEIIKQGEMVAAKIVDIKKLSRIKEEEQEIPVQGKMPADYTKDHTPFDFITEEKVLDLYHILHQEHPQTIALILSYLSPETSRIILLSFPEELQADILKRIACLKKADMDLVHTIEEYIKEKLNSLPGSGNIKGMKIIAQILKKILPEETSRLLTAIAKKDQVLVSGIKRFLEK